MEREGAEAPGRGPRLEARTSFYGTDDPSCRAFPPGRPGSNPNKPPGGSGQICASSVPFRFAKGDAERSERRGMPGADGG